MNMVNVLITGSKGYIGSALCEYLRYEFLYCKIIEYDVTDLDDILNLDRLVKVMKKNKIYIVIHLAALSSVTICNEDSDSAFRTNAIGTSNIMKAMKITGCKHIIYASTSSVYGNETGKIITESNLPVPCSTYGISKLLGEHIIYNHYTIKKNRGSYIIFRMFNVVGVSNIPEIDRCTNPGYDRLFSALGSGFVNIYGGDYKTEDGTCERDYVSLKDVCNAYTKGIIFIIINDVTKRYLYETINICSGHPISVKKLIQVWNRVREESYEIPPSNLPEVKYSITSRREGDPVRVVGSFKKAINILGWSPNDNVEKIIRDIMFSKEE